MIKTETIPVDFSQEISDFVFHSKYARYNETYNRRETWDECVNRVTRMHLVKYKFLPQEDLDKVKWAFQLVKEKKVVPSMRSMQFGGKAVDVKNERLYNCSVRNVDSIRSFAEIFFMLLCGNGVGMNVTEQFINRLPLLVDASDKTGTVTTYSVQDNIEGWADSVEALLLCYFRNTAYTGRKIIFDYSKVRPEGAPVKTGGGKAPGYKGLKRSHKKIKELLDHIIEEEGQTRLKPINAYDIIMHMADATLSGGIRRSACSIVFNKQDQEMMTAKTFSEVVKHTKFVFDDDTKKWNGKITLKNKKRYEVELTDFEYNDKTNKNNLLDYNRICWIHVNPQRARSNNSVLLLRSEAKKEDIEEIVNNARIYGEPGVAFCNDLRQNFNPCFEINFLPITSDGVCGAQFCNLSSINGAKITSQKDFLQATEAATIIGTLQAGYTDFKYLSQAAKQLTEEEALLGVSLTGWMDSPDILLKPENQKESAQHAIKTNVKWAKKIGINPAARITCVKPEGCLVPETKIKTSCGNLTLKEIFEINDYDFEQVLKYKDTFLPVNEKIFIYNKNNDLELITQLYINGNSETINIELEDGSNICCTKDHQFLTQRGWVKASDLTNQDDIKQGN
jgi:ribonucleoside-diphosphate reductase alpha chain